MCLTIELNEKKRPSVEAAFEKYHKVATRNITVFKLVTQYRASNGRWYKDSLESNIKLFKWTLNELYYQDEKDPTKRFSIIIRGYTRGVFDLCIDKGIHSYDSLKTLKFENPYCASQEYYRRSVMVECTIPKGSIYFKNTKGEIASDQLIMNKIIGEWRPS